MEKEKPCISIIQQCLQAPKSSCTAASGSEEEELALEATARTGYMREPSSWGFQARIRATGCIFPAASFTQKAENQQSLDYLEGPQQQQHKNYSGRLIATIDHQQIYQAPRSQVYWHIHAHIYQKKGLRKTFTDFVLCRDFSVSLGSTKTKDQVMQTCQLFFPPFFLLIIYSVTLHLSEPQQCHRVFLAENVKINSKPQNLGKK